MPLYRHIGSQCQLTVITTGQESLRTSWGDLSADIEGFEWYPSRGKVIKRTYQARGRVHDIRYYHFPVRLLGDILRSEPRAVISNEMGLRSAITYIAAKRSRAPCWIWWGGSPHTESKISGRKKAFRKLFSRLDVSWFSYGLTSTQYLLSLGIQASRITQLQNCIDETLYLEPSVPLVQPSVRPAIFTVGNLIRLKGLHLLLESAARVQRSGSHFSLSIVGEGPLRQDLEQTAATRDIQNVKFLGSFAPRDMPGVFQSFDGFVFPSLDDVWGLVLNEAIWSRVALISSIYAGATEESVPEEARFDPLNSNDFDDKLSSLVRGEITVPPTSNLKPCEAVAGQIIASLRGRVLES